MDTRSQTLTIVPVTHTAEHQQFMTVPDRIYAQDPLWVSPLKSEVAKQFQPSNPFFQYGQLQRFIAVENGQAVGRIGAAVNQRLIEREGAAIGLFGFFECIDDLAVAQALMNAASEWLRSQGMTHLRGPIDLSTHNHCLFLVDGFESAPYMMMPYNPPYYPQFMEKLGLAKAKDAYAYDLPLVDSTLMQGFEKAYRIAQKAGITFRPVHTKGAAFEQECRNLYRLFTQAFANNWSSTPRTEAEFLEEAQGLKSVVDPGLFPIAEYQGEMVGFFMGLPNYNLVFKHLKGKLDWLGILKFLWYRRSIDQARMIALCALPEHRRKMVAPALIYVAHRHATTRKPHPYRAAELSWVFEDNWPSRKLIEASGGKIYKTYRIYETSL